MRSEAARLRRCDRDGHGVERRFISESFPCSACGGDGVGASATMSGIIFGKNRSAIVDCDC